MSCWRTPREPGRCAKFSRRIYQQALALFEKVGDEDGKLKVLQCISVLSGGGNN